MKGTFRFCLTNSLFLLNFLDTTLSLSVYLNISSNDVSKSGLPNVINVTFQTDTNNVTELYLNRVQHMNSNISIYTIDTDNEGVKIKKEDVQGNENIAFYQDIENEAVIQLNRVNGSGGQSEEFIIKRGEYRQGNVTYSISPAARSRRQTSDDVNQSDFTSQHYDVRPIETPTERQTDFLTAPPEFETSKPVNVLSKKFQNTTKFSHRKRRSISTYYVDVTAFLDSTCYNRFLLAASYDEAETLRKIQEYYAFIFSGIDLIYQNFDVTNVHLRVNLNKILIFKSTASFKLFYLNTYSYKVDTKLVLNNLTYFLNSTAGRDYTFPNDHVMLFVGSDLWTLDGDILGLAWVKTLCRTDGVSASVIEDMGDYSAIITGAHELGHSLAANHDGVNNTCDYKDRYLMASSNSAPTDSTKQHPWRFSSCSINSIVSYITSLALTPDGQTCLSDALSVVGEFPDVSNRLLGQEYPPDKQCQMRYGSSSYDCIIRDTLSDICSMIYCYNPASYYFCYGQLPLSGTSCGCGKVCKQGDCVIDLSVPVTDCDIFTNCTSSMCQDNSASRYCVYTCTYYNGNLYDDSTTTFRTTVSATQSTVTTHPPTTNSNWCYDNTYFTKYGLTCRQLSSYGYCWIQEVQIQCCTSCNQGTTTVMTTPTTRSWCTDTYNLLSFGKSCWGAMQEPINMCYMSEVETSCCASCAERSTNTPGCEYGDKYRSVCSNIRSCDGLEDICCKTCGNGTNNWTTKTYVTTRSPTSIYGDWCSDDVSFTKFGYTCYDVYTYYHLCSYLDVQLACCASCGPATTTGMTMTTLPSWCMDSDYTLSSGKTCTEAMLEPINMCYIPEVQVLCCSSCAKRSTNIPGCEFGDKYRSMCPSLWSCNGKHNVCCETCSTGTSVMPDRTILMSMLSLVAFFHCLKIAD